MDVTRPLTLLDLTLPGLLDGPAEPEAQARHQPWPHLRQYRLLRELGRGSMGRVFLAEHASSPERLAIKTLDLNHEFDGYALHEARTRFHREAEAAQSLTHPDIIRVLSSGEDQGVTYLAMEVVHGRELSTHTQRDSLLPVAEVVRIGIRVAGALAHAHLKGVVHRDIKPSNIMYDRDPFTVKVMDFGIARVLNSARTRTGLVLGSPLYMAPEQLLGRPADGRCDLYALGATLYQLLTGEVPLHGSTMPELIHAVTHHPAPDPRTHRAELPDVLCDVVTLLLEKRPELRYRQAKDVAEDLEIVLARLPRRASYV